MKEKGCGVITIDDATEIQLNATDGQPVCFTIGRDIATVALEVYGAAGASAEGEQPGGAGGFASGTLTVGLGDKLVFVVGRSGAGCSTLQLMCI